MISNIFFTRELTTVEWAKLIGQLAFIGWFIFLGIYYMISNYKE